MSTPNGKSSSMRAWPLEAVASSRCRFGMLRRYSSCSIRISFSMSCGVAPGQEVRTEMVRTSRSGIICTGMRNAATSPMTAMMSAATVVSMPLRTMASNTALVPGHGDGLSVLQRLVAPGDHTLARLDAANDLHQAVELQAGLDALLGHRRRLARGLQCPHGDAAVGIANECVAGYHHRFAAGVQMQGAAGGHARRHRQALAFGGHGAQQEGAGGGIVHRHDGDDVARDGPFRRRIGT